MSVAETAREFFGAIERADLEALNRLYADDVKIWHNFSGKFMEKKTNVAILGKLTTAGNVKYVVQESHVVGDRLLQRHVLEIAMKGGNRVGIPAAIFLTIKNGRITELHEYVDSAHVVPGLI